MIKSFLKIIFPYDLPVSKRIFDSWVKILDDASKAAFLAAGPYFWIGSGSFTQRFVNTLVLLLAAYVAQVFIFYLDKYESKIVKQEQEPKERGKP